VREPLAAIQGSVGDVVFPVRTVRPATKDDIPACDVLCHNVHGHSHRGELLDAVAAGRALVVDYAGSITGYATGLAIDCHAVGCGNVDLQALIASGGGFRGSRMLIPSRNTALLHWCLDHGLRVAKQMNLMSIGLYNAPQGAWIPSISY